RTGSHEGPVRLLIRRASAGLESTITTMPDKGATIALGMLAGMLLCLPVHWLLTPRGDQTWRAWMDVKTLEKAVMSYQLKNGAWPERLEVLTRRPAGSEPLLEPGALDDPWGQPYRYNPARRNPNTNIPLIWSDGPPYY